MSSKLLTLDEIEQTAFEEKWKLCKCEFGVPMPTYVDPECPIHWNLSDGEGGLNAEALSPSPADLSQQQLTLDDLRDLFDSDGPEYTLLYGVGPESIQNDEVRSRLYTLQVQFQAIIDLVGWEAN